MSARPDGARGRPPRRSRGRLLCAVGALAGAGMLVVVAGRPWVTQVLTDVPGVGAVSASGDRAVPAAPALALVAATAAVALLAAGRFGRRLAAGVLVLAGLGGAAAVVSVVAAPGGAVAGAVTAATGRAGGVGGSPATVTWWVWPALASAVLVAICGVIAFVRAPTWPAPGRRFDAPAASGAASRVAPGAASRVAPGAASRVAPGAGAADNAPVQGQSDAIGAWDALSRGEDPTR